MLTQHNLVKPQKQQEMIFTNKTGRQQNQGICRVSSSKNECSTNKNWHSHHISDQNNRNREANWKKMANHDKPCGVHNPGFCTPYQAKHLRSSFKDDEKKPNDSWLSVPGLRFRCWGHLPVKSGPTNVCANMLWVHH